MLRFAKSQEPGVLYIELSMDREESKILILVLHVEKKLMLSDVGDVILIHTAERSVKGFIGSFIRSTANEILLHHLGSVWGIRIFLKITKEISRNQLIEYSSEVD